jgi:electron-transferring-flavoprotein dehydrogenase
MLKALVVDDEAPARSELRFLLGEAGGVEVVGEASNAIEALQLIKAIPYDVIFLDINMPGLSGVQLAEGVIELVRTGRPFTKENLANAYVARRRASWVESEGKVAERSRDGFQRGFITGMIGMGICGLTNGKIAAPGKPLPPQKRIRNAEDYFKGKILPSEIQRIKAECAQKGISVHDELMNRLGWPEVPFDGKLLVSHQDALLMGGKVQAPGGYADHVVFLDPKLCETCGAKVCYEICSAQAIQAGEKGLPVFDREKCVLCGACMWNCAQELNDGSGRTNIEFRAGAGGLHSAEN